MTPSISASSSIAASRCRRIEEILGGGAGGFLGFLLPYRRRLLVERRRIARFQLEIPGLDWLKLRAPDLRLAHRRLGRIMGPLRLAATRPSAGGSSRCGPATWIRCFLGGFFFLKLLQSLHHLPGRSAMIDFKRPVSSYFDFTFWAFPASTWGNDQSPSFLEFCEQWQRRTEASERPCQPKCTSSARTIRHGTQRAAVVLPRRGHLHARPRELDGRGPGGLARDERGVQRVCRRPWTAGRS